ncbi:hypothetical protein FSP39_022989 [Pinctada imbricata]|uniref:B box-type domain-containing protein n=1 Tax=Pinctada imbricata TaxID=66713 RepID=A0AA88XUW3_PINIB|nr:hypothetical protein FSP39_022989 [Pinctada imbricata]
MATNYTFRPVCDECELCDLKPWFCEGCNKNLCGKCKKSHVEKAVCKNHRILPIAREKEETESDMPESIGRIENGAKRCHLHENEVINRYCASCHELVCTACWNEKHDGHTEKEIQKMADELSIRLSGQILPKMKVDLEKLDSSMEAVRNNKFEYTACARSIRSEISDKVKFLVTTAEHTQASLLTELSSLEDQDLGILNAQESSILEKKQMTEIFIKTYEAHFHQMDPLTFLTFVLQASDILNIEDESHLTLPSVDPPSLCDVEYVTKASIAKILERSGNTRKKKKSYL